MSSQKQIESNRQRGKSVRICFGICFALGVLVTLLGETLVASLREKNTGTVVPALASAASPLGLPKTGSQGPWGNLEYRRIPLENYEEQFPHGLEPVTSRRWVFENYSRQQLVELFNSCDLTDAQKAWLLDTNRWEALANGYEISPNDELVLGLSKITKQRLYPILGRSETNYMQWQPFRFPLNGINERFADSGLPPQKIALIRELTYTNGDSLCLCADEPALKSFTSNEFQCLARTLYSTPTLRVGLRVTPGSDIDALVKYWGRGGREKAIRPLLESLARIPGGESINISCLLPPFARLRLYTYVDPQTELLATKEDCFYTALNFFSGQPDPQLANGDYARKEMSANYYRIQDNLIFGDLIALVNPEQKPVHICVYVADDVVFTKQGSGLGHPWVLMKIPDMLADYAFEKSLSVVHFRRKDMI
jgi:hypothetical protein